MKYCKKCLMPSTKPSLRFNDSGVCSACQWHERKSLLYNDTNRRSLSEVVRSFNSNGSYDCIIPVSGGKDSTYQVWRALQEGLTPLCVTAPTDYLTPLGRKNIENIKRMPVDHIEVSVNMDVRRKINRYALTHVGDVQWPEHVLIFTIPVHIAVKFGIPVILWGENSVREYGAGRPEDEEIGVEFTRDYLEENCGFNGLRVSDLSEVLDIDKKFLGFYSYPDQEQIDALGLKGLFLDDFFPWNGMTNQLIARAYGFKTASENIVGSLTNYENLDNYYHGIHDYIKYLKFGFSRSTDIACNWIRRGLISRKDALELVELHDGRYPTNYLDKDLAEILSSIGLSQKDFDEICDEYTNYEIFKVDSFGNLIRRDDGSPELLSKIF